jgi:hypothetical protein
MIRWLMLILCMFCFAFKPVESNLIIGQQHRSSVSKFLNAKKWNELFPNRYNLRSKEKKPDFYSFKCFEEALKHFPLFLNEGDEVLKKRELAAFLANIAMETSAGWEEAPGGYFKWGLYYLEENGCGNGCAQYSDTVRKKYLPVAGKSYHGRGPVQLSWNYNYGQFSEYYFGSKDSLLNHPEIIATDATVAFASAIWFWMTTQLPKPSCHDVIINKWVPSSKDSAANRLPGFGAVLNVINGGIECGNSMHEKTKYRYLYYQYFCKYFGVTEGENATCVTQKPFGQ